MIQNYRSSLRAMVFSALFTTLIIIGSYICIPLPFSPIPIVLSDFFVMLAGLLLGASWGMASVSLFLLTGLIGLPVFSGGKAGLAVFFGPTGGYLIGYLLGAFAIGYIANLGKQRSVIKDLIALILGNILFFAAGVSWLKVFLKLTWEKSILFGLLPLIIGNIIKIIAAVILSRFLRAILKYDQKSGD
jgi:biotin transport system substrate-specific component